MQAQRIFESFLINTPLYVSFVFTKLTLEEDLTSLKTNTLKIATQNETRILVRVTQFRIRINNFSTSYYYGVNASQESTRINVHSTEWYIRVKEQNGQLGAYIYGERSDGKSCSFDVVATFKFKRTKQLAIVEERKISSKYCFTASNGIIGKGCSNLARIDVIFYLIGVIPLPKVIFVKRISNLFAPNFCLFFRTFLLKRYLLLFCQIFFICGS